ncbi:MAG: DNA-directed RNA polymerase subunit D [Candidatus Verstraetearchaeota archaeon]|nr:DNA-directed RNA polymerase subunit D [Candidatus Verstraetearchaeota archaeon]
MEVKILEEQGDLVRFAVHGADIALINAIRRVSIAEVPTLAIERVFIMENTSSFFDEIVAHRLGLIPLKVEEGFELNLPEECECGGAGCFKCEVRLFLEVREAPVDNYIVYSGHLRPEIPEVKVVSEKIPIVALAKGQSLVLEARARLGRGKEHAKWQPVAVAAYKYFPILSIDREKCYSCGLCVENCPKKILELDEEEKPRVTDIYACSLCRACEEVCDAEAISVKGSERDFIFTLETTGALTPREVILKACEILCNKLSQLRESFAQLEGGQGG